MIVHVDILKQGSNSLTYVTEIYRHWQEFNNLPQNIIRHFTKRGHVCAHNRVEEEANAMQCTIPLQHSRVGRHHLFVVTVGIEQSPADWSSFADSFAHW